MGECYRCQEKIAAALKRRKLMKPTHGVKEARGGYDVVANSGRPEGRYATRAEAAKRVREIEYFKHAKGR